MVPFNPAPRPSAPTRPCRHGSRSGGGDWDGTEADAMRGQLVLSLPWSSHWHFTRVKVHIITLSPSQPVHVATCIPIFLPTEATLSTVLRGNTPAAYRGMFPPRPTRTPTKPHIVFRMFVCTALFPPPLFSCSFTVSGWRKVPEIPPVPRGALPVKTGRGMGSIVPGNRSSRNVSGTTQEKDPGIRKNMDKR